MSGHEAQEHLAGTWNTKGNNLVFAVTLKRTCVVAVCSCRRYRVVSWLTVGCPATVQSKSCLQRRVIVTVVQGMPGCGSCLDVQPSFGTILGRPSSHTWSAFLPGTQSTKCEEGAVLGGQQPRWQPALAHRQRDRRTCHQGNTLRHPGRCSSAGWGDAACCQQPACALPPDDTSQAVKTGVVTPPGEFQTSHLAGPPAGAACAQSLRCPWRLQRSWRCRRRT